MSERNVESDQKRAVVPLSEDLGLTDIEVEIIILFVDEFVTPRVLRRASVLCIFGKRTCDITIVCVYKVFK